MSETDKFRGIYGKYRVERNEDPTGKHKSCFYFVLDIEHDKFAVTALSAYAQACKEEYPQLALELNALVSRQADWTQAVIDATKESFAKGLHVFTCWCCDKLCQQNKAPERALIRIFQEKNLSEPARDSMELVCETCSVESANLGGGINFYRK